MLTQEKRLEINREKVLTQIITERDVLLEALSKSLDIMERENAELRKEIKKLQGETS